MLTLERFRQLEVAICDAGFEESIAWSEAVSPATTATEFAEAAIYVICNSGMRASIAGRTYERCVAALRRGASTSSVFAHAGKAAAIDYVWLRREELFSQYVSAPSPIEFCATLPFVGPITKHHLAKNLGADVAKADVHLQRLADVESCSVQELCERLAKLTGYRIATIDTILWRACAQRILDSRAYRDAGWEAAFKSATAS